MHNFQNGSQILRTAAAALFAVQAFMPLQLSAQEAEGEATPPKAEKHGDWVKVCEPLPGSEQEVCGLVQNVMLKETGQSVLKAIVRKEEAGSTIMLNLPLGFSLPPGIQIRIDQGDPLKQPVHTCTEGGCLAGWILDDNFIAAMKQGARLSITLVDLNDSPFEIPVSLTGFTKGYASISAE